VALAVYAGSGSDDAVLWLGHVVVATLIGLGLQLAGVRGPLEAVVSAAGRAVRRGVTGVTAKPVDSEPPRPPGR
jgi:chloramphenicol 3-O-phosphotransferase